MISAAAIAGVNQIFTRAAARNLIVAGNDPIAIEPVVGKRPLEPPGTQFLVLTISSYLFRLLTMIHYTPDRATRAYFNRNSEERSFGEAFGEVGNLCCGQMKRDLGDHFMHLGLSTPYTLDGKCMAFLDLLKPTHLSQYEILINGNVPLHATLCLCAYGELDFRARTDTQRDEAAVSTGALELF